MTSPLPRHGMAKPSRSLLGPRIGLPLMALGIAALIPARLTGLLPLFERPVPVATTPKAEMPASEGPGIGLSDPVAPSRPVSIREGVIATPTVSAVLAGSVRISPVGDDRQADSRLLAEVARRQAETERRERMVELREARATAAETMARAQLAALTKLRDELERLVVRESETAEADIDALVALYVNMRPQQAAKVLERLEAPRAAVILLKIPERQAGPILAQMDPQAALVVTQEIAGRREAFRR